jgi:predicted ester cyclase
MDATPRDVIERYYREVWDGRQPELIPTLFASTYKNHAGARGTLEGPAGIRANYDATLAAFADVQFTRDETITEHDRVVVRYTMVATHTGPFMHLKPTGRAVNVPGIGIYRVADGLVQESWVVRDSLMLLRQLGAEIG